MKKIILFLFLFPAVVFFYAGCERGEQIEEPIIEKPVEEEPLIESDENGNMAIIGVDPCTVDPESGLPAGGHFIRLINTGDTVVTYNLPKKIAIQIGRSIKGVGLDSYTMFPPDKVFKIKLSYEYTKESDNYYPVCLVWFTSPYDRYIKKQITIISDNEAK